MAMTYRELYDNSGGDEGYKDLFRKCDTARGILAGRVGRLESAITRAISRVDQTTEEGRDLAKYLQRTLEGGGGPGLC